MDCLWHQLNCSLESSWQEHFCPQRLASHNLACNVAGVGWNPLAEWDSVMPDIDRLCKSIICGATDKRNINLHFDELFSELQQKVTFILNRRDVLYLSRESFFGLLKISLKRHVDSLIQKYVFTYKRTGIKPPKRGERQQSIHRMSVDDENFCDEEEQATETTRPGCIALDDDELGASSFIGAEAAEFKDMELMEEFEHFIKENLTDVEEQVIRQEIQPNDKAMKLAYEASQNSGHSQKFKIMDRHKAEGIGIAVHAYKRTMLRIKAKLQKSWTY